MKTVLFALALAMPIGAQTLDAATGERSSVTVLNTVLGAKLPKEAVIFKEGGGLSIANPPAAHELCTDQMLFSQDGIVIGIICGFPDYSEGSEWLDRIKRRYGDPTEAKEVGFFLWKNPTSGIAIIRVALVDGVDGGAGWIEWISTEASYESWHEIADAIKTANESDLAF